MDKYNFKVILELRDDLNDEDKQAGRELLAKWQKAYNIIEVEKNTYCKEGNNERCSDFGGVTFFYLALKKYKKYFKKLEYYDMWGGSTDIAV